ncbi:Hypothetical predicted protein [Olea europaea subsp. europaea]|uniref:Uncharacterized protein n=1 Tax=Olea europaea subsp. europaea TaxID=158383 RepID=A0A8S0V6S4_OLEEU|nr:Hypothetical predicted protein [Olea europaea subsp. europaea]
MPRRRKHRTHRQLTPTPPPPQLPSINHSTTTEILSRAAVIFYRHLPTFLALSLILWFIRSTVEEMYDGLTHDYEPSVKDLLARMEYPSAHRIRQESQLSPVRTDDNFFSGDSHDHPQSNQSGGNTTNSSFEHVNSFPQIILPGGFSFRAEIPKNNDTVNKSVERSLDDPLIEFDLELLRKGLVNGLDDVSLLFTLRIVSRVVYAFAFFTSSFAYTWAHGIVFLQVIDHLSGNQRSVYHSILNGATFGCKRLLQFSFFVFLVVAMRVMFIPFINLVPWVQGPQWEIADFTVKWFCTDLIVGCIFSVATWVAVVEWPISIIEISQETWHLLAAFRTPALEIRVLEAIICGSFGRGIVWTFFGNSCSLAFQCVMEVFFLVAWVLYYLSARNLLGRGQMQALLGELYVH